MKRVSECINDINVYKNKYINDINVNTNKSKYMLDKSKFIPNTEESQLAEEISISLNDMNFACFLKVVNEIGCSEARRLLTNVLDDIEDKKKTKTPVRNAGAYFMWKFRNKKY